LPKLLATLSKDEAVHRVLILSQNFACEILIMEDILQYDTKYYQEKQLLKCENYTIALSRLNHGL
jgi:hypothetical protein